jgi:hypothetical protein
VNYWIVFVPTGGGKAEDVVQEVRGATHIPCIGEQVSCGDENGRGRQDYRVRRVTTHLDHRGSTPTDEGHTTVVLEPWHD